jgi:hypothetical protein
MSEHKPGVDRSGNSLEWWAAILGAVAGAIRDATGIGGGCWLLDWLRNRPDPGNNLPTYVRLAIQAAVSDSEQCRPHFHERLQPALDNHLKLRQPSHL